MTNSTKNPSDSREQLVAYLDGELDEASARRIEDDLAESGTLRNELDTLSRTWDLLDELDDVRASEAFTNRTLMSIENERTSEHVAIERREALGKLIPVILCACGMLAAAVVGFRAARQEVAPDTQMLLDDFEVIQSLDVYRDARDVEFLRELQRRGVFDDDQ